MDTSLNQPTAGMQGVVQCDNKAKYFFPKLKSQHIIKAYISNEC